VTSLAHSRSVLTGLSMLGSIAVLGAVVSVAWQNAANHIDGGEPPLVQVPDLPWKLQPDSLLANLSPAERGQRGLDRLLPEEDDGDPPATGAGLPLAPPPDVAPPLLPAVPTRPLPAAPPAASAPPLAAPAPPAPVPPAATGSVEYRVQLLAASDQAAAERAWDGLRARFGPILADYRPHIEAAKLAAGTVYRVQIGPFATLAAARATCAELERQRASCFVLRLGPRT
jgi:cell division septation protein DedD